MAQRPQPLYRKAKETKTSPVQIENQKYFQTLLFAFLNRRNSERRYPSGTRPAYKYLPLRVRLGEEMPESVSGYLPSSSSRDIEGTDRTTYLKEGF